MIVDFNIPNNALIHWLRNTNGVWREPSKSHVGKFDMGVACCLSKNNKTCRFCIFILPLKAVNHSSMFCDVIHTFLLDLHSTGSFRMSRFQKHRGFAALPITWGFSISPDIKPQRKTVNLSFYSFPPKHFSPFRHSDLFGSAWKNSPVSSLFAMFSGSYSWIMDGRLSTHCSVLSLFISLDSQQISLKTI